MISAERLHVTCLVRADHTSAHLTKARLHDLASHRLAEVLGSAFAPHALDDDRSIWVIRRLAADVDLDIESSDDDTIERWARQLSSCLADKLDPDDPDVVRFASRAAYLARYVAERAAGTAHDQWYFRLSEGLRALPASAAIRTALADDPAEGLQALRLLANPDLARIASTMSDADARRVLAAVAAESFSLPGFAVLVEAWTASAAGRSHHAGGAALCAFVELSRTQPAGREAARTLAAMSAFAWLARESPGSSVRELAEVLASAGFVGLVRHAGVSRAEQLAPLLGCPIEILRRLTPAPATALQPDDGWRHTPFGGVFLLLPRLAELPLPEEFGNVALLRLWIAIKCVGTARAFPALLDPLVREVLGVDEHLSVDAFVKWQASVPRAAFRSLDDMLAKEEWRRENSDVLQPGDAQYLTLPSGLRASRTRDRRIAAASQRVLRSFAWRLPGFSTASFTHLFDNFLDCPARLQDRPGACIVTLGRAPLSIVLNLTGTGRDTFACPWRSGLVFQLFPEG